MKTNSENIKLTARQKVLLKSVFDDCMKEDRSVRERQVRKWKQLKLLWEGFQRIWYDFEAHDYRIWDNQITDGDSDGGDQDYYDKPVNVFAAYLDSILAALSVTVPAIKAFPEDAENPSDLLTAKASDKIAALMYRHNNVALFWLHSLFIYATEGMTACYSYPDSDESYGTYEEEKYEEEVNDVTTANCPLCSYSQEIESGADTLEGQEDICPQCNEPMTPSVKTEQVTTQKVVGKDIKPKTRVCMEVYGGLNVKIGNYVKCQADLPYLIYSCEEDYSMVIDEYDDELDDDQIDKIKEERGSYSEDDYGQWGRLSPQYQNEVPENVVTVHCAWIRCAKFNILEHREDIKELKKLFPKGVKLTVIGDEIICAKNESLDKHWTLTKQATSDYLHFEPLGTKLVSVQDITNDLISLTLQTIEHGIGQTFVDPAYIDLVAYRETEATPGGVFPSKPLGNKKLADGISQLKTATLSGEVGPFGDRIQSLGQMASGSLPSIFGGQLEGSETASEYSMSRNQALQRLQNTWKVFTAWWKEIFLKNIPMFIENMKTDEKDVKLDRNKNFVNILIERSDLTGKIGKVELEANENLPMTWGQRKDLIEKILVNTNPEIAAIVTSPENRPLLHEYLGIPDFYVPGEDDVIKQYEEIRLLLASEPITEQGPQGENQVPSVEIDPIYDNHQIEFEIVRKWIISEEGRLAKVNNKPGYDNVLLHGIMHFEQIQAMMGMQQQAEQSSKGDGANPKKNKEVYDKNAPVKDDKNVPVTH